MWVDNRVVRATALVVNAPWTVTGFTADVLRIGSFGLNAHVGGGLEIADDLSMTLRASLRTDIFRAGDLRRGDDRALHGRARNHAEHCDQRARDDQGDLVAATQNYTTGS